MSAFMAGMRHVYIVQGAEKECKLVDAFRLTKLKREDVFVSLELSPTCESCAPNDVVRRVGKSMEIFGIEYVDLLVVPWTESYERLWKGVEECAGRGLAKDLSISCFPEEGLKRLCSIAVVKPSLYLCTVDLQSYDRVSSQCATLGLNLGVMCSWDVARRLANQQAFIEVGHRGHTTPLYALLRWYREIGCVTLLEGFPVEEIHTVLQMLSAHEPEAIPVTALLKR